MPGDQVGEVTSLWLDEAISPVAKQGHRMLSIEELNLGVLLLSFCLWFCCNVLFVITLGLRLLKRWGFRDYPFWMLLSLATSLNTCWVYIPSVILEIPVVRKEKKKKTPLRIEAWILEKLTHLRPNMSGRKTSRPHSCLLWGCGALTHLSVLSLLSGLQRVGRHWSDSARTKACRVL